MQLFRILVTRIIVIALLALSFQRTHCFIKVINVKCTSLDESFCDFPQCNLKVYGRGIVGLNIHARLHQPPISNIAMSLSLYKRVNGYRPFLYNVTVDVCDFIRNRKRYPFMNIVFGAIKDVSNMNHTCPYNHDIIVRRAVLEDEMLSLMPLPTGQYMFRALSSIYKIWRTEIKVFIDVIDKKQDA